MKKLAVALAGALMILLPIGSTGTPGHVHDSSTSRNIDWD